MISNQSLFSPHSLLALAYRECKKLTFSKKWKKIKRFLFFCKRPTFFLLLTKKEAASLCNQRVFSLPHTLSLSILVSVLVWFLLKRTEKRKKKRGIGEGGSRQTKRDFQHSISHLPLEPFSSTSSELVARAQRCGLLRAHRDWQLDVLGALDSPSHHGRGEHEAEESQNGLTARDGRRGALEELGLESGVAGAVGLAVHVPGPGGVLEVLLEREERPKEREGERGSESALARVERERKKLGI